MKTCLLDGEKYHKQKPLFFMHCKITAICIYFILKKAKAKAKKNTKNAEQVIKR